MFKSDKNAIHKLSWYINEIRYYEQEKMWKTAAFMH